MRNISPKIVITALYLFLVLVALWGGIGWERARIVQKQQQIGIQ